MKNYGRTILRGLVCTCCLAMVLTIVVEGRARAGECGQGLDRKKVVSMLRAGGFSGVLDADALGDRVLDELRIEKIGSVKTAHGCLNLFFYAITHHLPGNEVAARQRKRLLVLSDSSYLGSYMLNDAPTRLNGNVLEFPQATDPDSGMDLGSRIVFDSDQPPARIRLDGEIMHFSK